MAETFIATTIFAIQITIYLALALGLGVFNRKESET